LLSALISRRCPAAARSSRVRSALSSFSIPFSWPRGREPVKRAPNRLIWAWVWVIFASARWRADSALVRRCLVRARRSVAFSRCRRATCGTV
jgi:hypothetical protein